MKEQLVQPTQPEQMVFVLVLGDMHVRSRPRCFAVALQLTGRGRRCRTGKRTCQSGSKSCWCATHA